MIEIRTSRAVLMAGDYDKSEIVGAWPDPKDHPNPLNAMADMIADAIIKDKQFRREIGLDVLEES
ncbi:MAG: hypothetical protein K0Q53_1520 [Massilibacillus sp.]|jgi:hypothetical protein|nr:hypothetical protein [Massilibacillus sp.]